MRWAVETLPEVDAEIADLPTGLQTRIVRMFTLIEDVGMSTLAEMKAKLMVESPGFAAAWEEADAEFQVIEAMIRARAGAGLTQGEIARRMGTTQSAVARLEGGRVSPSVETLRRYGKAAGKRLRVVFE